MDRPNSALFDVFLRLRPSEAQRDRFLDVDRDHTSTKPTHITIKPPADDKRKRAVERFGFTRVFEEDAGQLDLFHETGAVSMVEGVLGAPGREGKDGLLATLGVTGSGKVHILRCISAKHVRMLTFPTRATRSWAPRPSVALLNSLSTHSSRTQSPTLPASTTSRPCSLPSAVRTSASHSS